MLCRITRQFSGCSACWFILGINDVPVRQAEVAKGNLIVLPWNLRKVPLGVYWTRLLAATSRAGPMLWRWDPVPTVPPCWVCHARACCWPVLKTMKSCASTYTHPSLSIAWDTSTPLRAVTYIYTRVYICTHACYPHKWTMAFLSIWVLQGDATKVFPLTTCTVEEKREDFLSDNLTALCWRPGTIALHCWNKACMCH